MHRDEIARTEELVNKLRGPEAVFFGLDVGRAVDHSALSALVRYLFPVGNQVVSKYYCVYLKRYDLKTPYEQIEEDCGAWWSWADLIGMRRYFIIDMTGVGAPVLEGIRRKRVRAIGVNITGGLNEANPDIDQFNVPKAALTTTLLRTAQMGRFKGYDTLEHWKELTEELSSFGYKINKDTANITYESLDDKVHDDLVISVALPVWYGERVVPNRIGFKSRSEVETEEYNPLA